MVQFQAQGAGGVSWSVDGPGTVTADGLFSAPASVDTATAANVVATDKGNSKRRGAGVAVVGQGKPMLSSVTPSSVAAGSPDITVTVEGSNFLPGIQALFDGTAVATTWKSTEVLSVVLPANLLSTPRAAPLTAQNGPQLQADVGLVFDVDGVARTVAGGKSQEGDLALTSPMTRAENMTVYNNEIYYSEPERHRIMKLENGRLRVIAGTGVCGKAADGQLAVEGPLCHPTALAFDAAGNLYFSDEGNLLIRRISGGVISTVAGRGPLTDGSCHNDSGEADPPSRDALLAYVGGIRDMIVRGDDLYFATCECNGNRIRRLGPLSNDSARKVHKVDYPYGQLVCPKGIAFDPQERIYASAYFANIVGRISGGAVSTVAGNGQAGADGDGGSALSATVENGQGLAIKDGALYIAQPSWFRIRKVLLQPSPNDTISLFAGGNFSAGFISPDGATAADAIIGKPTSLAFVGDSLHFLSTQGFVFSTTNILAVENDKLRTVSNALKAGNVLYDAQAGDVLAKDAFLYSPLGLGFDSKGALYISDSGNHTVWKVGANGLLTRYLGNLAQMFDPDGTGTLRSLDQPQGLWVDGDDNVHLVELGSARIRRMGLDDNFRTVAGGGRNIFENANSFPADSSEPQLDGAAFLLRPHAVVVAGNFVYLNDVLMHRVRRVNLTTQKILTVAGQKDVQPDQYRAGNGVDGTQATGSSPVLNQPMGMALDPNGDLVIADSGNHKVRKVNLTTGVLTTLVGTGEPGFSGDGGPATAAKLTTPYGVLYDKLGNLYISDYGAHVIRRVDVNGTIHTVAGRGGVPGATGDGVKAKDTLLQNPTFMTFGPDSQTLFFSDSGNHRVRSLGR
jgi:hypothetical protein